MSRYTVPAANGHSLDYGFDHNIGPFLELYDGDHLVEADARRFNPSFDCHALADYLNAHADAGYIEWTPTLQHHLTLLTLDLPI